MDLILWRHAEALDTVPDATRKLSARGEKQAKQMAAWLTPRLPRNTRILVSPATRCQQTAAALGLDFETSRALFTDASVADLIAATDWPTGGSVLVVGHQPTLGNLAALLLAGQEMAWSVKKGGIWWLSNRERDSSMQVVLRCSIAPDQL